MDLKDNLKILREKRGITQQELADGIGISNKAVSTWENGSKVPRQPKLEKLADYFNVSVDYLLGRDSPQWEDFDKEHSEYINKNIKLSDLLKFIGFTVEEEPSEEFYIEDVTDDNGLIIGQTKIPQFYTYIISKGAVSVRLSQDEFDDLPNKLSELTALFIQLNDRGQEKAVEALSDLTAIDKYLK